MTTARFPLHLLATTLVALVLMAPGARAASIFIDAANLEDQVAFNFGQFEGGFSINGSTPITTGGSVFGEGTQLNFTGQWIDLGAATAFSRTVYWTDPEDNPNPACGVADPVACTVISDILQWTVTPSGASGLATISGFFTADPVSPTAIPGGTLATDIIVEQADGGHDPFNFSAAFLGGQVITGAAIPDVVPEPSAHLLLALGLLAVILGYRRRAAA